MSLRLFIAVDLGASVAARAQRQLTRLTPLAPRARWVRPDALHVTLAFLGHVEEARETELAQVLHEVARGHRPLALRAEGGGSFGARRRPTVLWVGLTGDVEALAAIKAELDRRLTPLGYSPEARPFQPHLTLARSRERAGDPALAACAQALEGVALGEARVDRLVLFRSVLSPGGARYTPSAEAPLEGDGLC